jgi:hypothetical protein
MNMTNHLVKFPLESGGFVYVESSVQVPEGGVVKASRGIPGEAVQSFEQAINALSPLSNSIISKIINTANPPDEANVEFGLTLTGELGLTVITKVGTEANFKISLKWTREKQKS